MPIPIAEPRKLARVTTAVLFPFEADIETLAECVGSDRHLRTVCRCGAVAEFDPGAWLQRGLGYLSVANFADRLRCPCGSRQGVFEVWPGAAGHSGLAMRSAASLYE
jgi:hypothetical protein